MQGGESGGGGGGRQPAAMELGSAFGGGAKRRRYGDEGESSAAREVPPRPVNHFERIPAEMHEQILDLLPLDDAIRTSVLSPWWRDTVRRRLVGHSVQVEFSPPDTQLEKLVRLVERPARHLKIFSLVVDHYISHARGELVRRFLAGARQSTVEHLYVHLRSSSARDRVTFYFHYLNPLLQSLTLRGINLSARLFDWVSPPFAHLTTIHLNSVRITDELLGGTVSFCRPALRVLKVLYRTRLRDVSIMAPMLRFFTVAECENLESVVLVNANRLCSYHNSGSPSSFYIPPGAAMLTDLYICSATTLLPGQVSDEWNRFRDALPILSNITALTICSNSLKILSSLRGAEVAYFRNLRELQFIMFELKAVDLDNIYEFLRTCTRPNLTELFVQLPTPSDHGPFEHDLIGEQRQNPLEDGLATLEVAKIVNFNWRRHELKLVIFLLKKVSRNHRLLLVSPRRMPSVLGLQQEDLSRIQAALTSGQLRVIGILEDRYSAYRPIHSKIYRKF